MSHDPAAATSPSETASAGATTSFGFRDVPLAEKQHLVDDVFHKVASRYDVMNDAMSAGMHRLWKDAMVARLSPPKIGRRPYEVLDMAGGRRATSAWESFATRITLRRSVARVRWLRTLGSRSSGAASRRSASRGMA